MHLEVVAPSPALAQYVEYYGLWEDEQGDAQQAAPRLRPLPVGGVGEDNVVPSTTDQDAKGRAATRGQAEMVGVITRQQLYLRQAGRPGGLGIYFRPAGFFHLFGALLPATAATKHEVDHRAERFTHELLERLSQVETNSQWLAVANELLLRQLRGQQPAPGAIDLVASRILHQHGQVNIEALAHDAGLSRRQLERRFLTEVGAPPKLYARFARFHHVLQLLAARPAPSWQDIAYRCGYYDQAHFIREFRFFTGKSPGAYSLLDSDFTRYAWAF